MAGIVALMILAAGKGEDITGIVMPGLLLTFVAAVGAAVMTVIQRHVQKATELSTLEGFCKALECQPGDILEYSNGVAST